MTRPANFSSPGNRCPHCTGTDVRVIDTRIARGDVISNDTVRRRRKCMNCSGTWGTVEVHKSMFDIWKEISKRTSKNEIKTATRAAARKQKDDQREKLRKAVRKIEGRNQ